MDKVKWYNRKGLVILWLFLFWPVGLFGLFKSKTFKKALKVILGIIFSFFGILFLVAIFTPSNEDKIVKMQQNTQDLEEQNKMEEDARARLDHLNLGDEIVKELVGKSVPYDKWSEWGSPQTLEGTNNSRWVVYLEKANISFVSNKATDIINFAGFGKNAAYNYIKNLENARKEKIESQFSAWDGSHINLTTLIKNNMNDRKSYKHVKTVYWDNGNYLIVQTTFRGKNAFGALVLNTFKAKVSLDGEILEILEQN